MSVGNVTASAFCSWLTKESAKTGELYYTTKEVDEIISILGWFNEHNRNSAAVKRLTSNSITIQAPTGYLRIFPLRRIQDNPQFGILVETGTTHVLKGIEYEGIMIYGPAGQQVRFYFDNA